MKWSTTLYTRLKSLQRDVNAILLLVIRPTLKSIRGFQPSANQSPIAQGMLQRGAKQSCAW